MATLAPALLYFAPGAGLDVLGLLRGGKRKRATAWGTLERGPGARGAGDRAAAPLRGLRDRRPFSCQRCEPPCARGAVGRDPAAQRRVRPSRRSFPLTAPKALTRLTLRPGSGSKCGQLH